ncbi:non-hydrolyzing UDP-N-acetylglucosamine 2-epimerase [Mariniblastus fucicola]|uniref:UDP-N-acetylglucosamine 2-epimerase (non-hydrolyzing) n=1 Tax=Mariniblastus fucicola TaxID=980251 RepID=A0A5B9PB16_9BACT|nr:UDP-N-acetylglucosamine 2-epimerase (non-hydrolyzing) [Mariniblastus fucicola]QEG20303.1 UDP-N-acetylglucosamine 2-epimerase [Mariniblastus fucicola]
MARVAVFMGTRPEGIKMAPVVKAIEAAEGLEPIVVSTGQHKEMLQQVVDLFEINVDHDLEVMQPNQTLPSLTARLITRIDELLEKTQPDMALVQGDTTTVFTAALCCFYRGIPVGHVEAGLRTGNMRSPFPEEANRKLACPLVSLHFPPTENSKNNLILEHIDSSIIHVTGNTVIDALHLEIARQESADNVPIKAKLIEAIGEDFTQKPYVLVTGHRRENFGGGFEEICTALSTLAKAHPEYLFIYPVHLNPRVQKPVYDTLGQFENIKLIPPQPYSEFVMLINNSRIVLTDSGGVQEEAPSLGKPVLVMRDTTERPEGVDAGTVKLVGAVAENIIRSVSELIKDHAKYELMAHAKNPYGDGKAAMRIAETVKSFLRE